MNTWKIIPGDCRTAMAGLAEASVDAVVTDPPYGLTSKNESPLRASPDADQRKRNGGFMGMKWDARIPGPEFWEAARRVTKPGGHLLAFGGARTFHRLAVAIEDAGWEIRDTLCWLYGSGFPKSHNGPWGGTALKPAWEPIILARKPLEGTVAKNFEKHKTGALNIDTCRIPVDDQDYEENFPGPRGVPEHRTKAGSTSMRPGAGQASEKGRWPANLVLDEEAAAQLDAAVPEAGACAPVKGTEPSRPGTNVYGDFSRGGGAFHDDGRGGASRFFYTAKAGRDERNEGLRGFVEKDLYWGTFQSAGTMKAAQNHHPTVKPIDLMSWLCRLVTPRGGLVLDPFAGSGSTGVAAIAAGFNFLGCEIEPEYVAIARARIGATSPLLAKEI